MHKEWLMIGAAAIFFCTNVAQAAEFGADRHMARGVSCASCHGEGVMTDPSKVSFPDETTCLTCHNREAVAEKTKAVEPNPHLAPHNGECTLCHVQHDEPQDYCAECHSFGYKVR